jgi:hypothetical protein
MDTHISNVKSHRQHADGSTGLVYKSHERYRWEALRAGTPTAGPKTGEHLTLNVDSAREEADGFVGHDCAALGCDPWTLDAADQRGRR